jgi:hypothetical protein
MHYKVIKAIKTKQMTLGGKTFVIIWSTFCELNALVLWLTTIKQILFYFSSNFHGQYFYLAPIILLTFDIQLFKQ